MPADDGLWTDEAQDVAPPWPAPREVDPEEPVEGPELRPFGALRQEGELLSKSDVLQRQIGAGAQG